MKLNLPNKLTLLRILLVPVFLVLLIAVDFGGDTTSRIVCAALFVVTCLTDTLDGIIARKYNMVTNFGKFLDPLADKFIVFAALLGILVKYPYLNRVFVWAAAIVMFRELAVTSMRLVVASKNVVVAAGILGKIKTVSQMICITLIILEPVILPASLYESHIIVYVMTGIMTVMTLWSGIDYFVKYGKYITAEK
ncbi:MAG: CDP-diacylglycerol--glycerol-3-phosphate 3-phosphatidyltransferase [Clostridia bacterium]|nr:CDP-diacylglycerol--glycerol-3-phosphate 3-phosphatidyltransferase [Clostridia bacterium]